MRYSARIIRAGTAPAAALLVMLTACSCSFSVLESVKRGANHVTQPVTSAARSAAAPVDDLTKPLRDELGKVLGPAASQIKSTLNPVIGTVNETLSPLKKVPGELAWATSNAILDPFSSGDYRGLAQAKADRVLMESRIRPATTVTGKRELTLADCRRLALLNNGDIRISRWEERTREAAADISKTGLLPHLILTGEAYEGDIQRFTYSDVYARQGLVAEPLPPGPFAAGVNQFSSGRERNQWRYQLELNWSPNEAALSYFQARNAKNDGLAAHYQRVGKIQEVFGVIDAAYFRLLALQELVPLAAKLTRLREYVSSKLAEQTRENLASMDMLDQAKQREVRARIMYEQFKSSSQEQRNRLASAMGISPGQCVDGGFTLAGELSPPPTDPDICESVLSQMERIAVRNRPELYRAVLDRLKAGNDVKRVFLNYFPRVTGFWRRSHDNDKYLFHKDYKEYGVNIRYDLQEVLRTLEETQAARNKHEAGDRSIDSTIGQIALDARRRAINHFDATARLRANAEALQSSQAVLAMAQNKYSLGDLDRLHVEQARADVLEKRIELFRAVGEANATLAELNRAMAVNYREPPPEG